MPRGLEHIEDSCFACSGVEEVSLPSTLIKINPNAFYCCDNLRTIIVAEGCAFNIRSFVRPSVRVVERLSGLTMVGQKRLCDLRLLRDLEIPDGVETIGERWFAYSWVESVAVPASVKTIDREAFYGCEKLRRVIFAIGGLLEMLGEGCFAESGVEEVAIPASVTTICQGAFQMCKSLKKVTFDEGSRLEVMGERCLRGT